jgi:diguanylate cyclase (GGDEF)-like protein/PAS domain S-box-containing protein
MKKHLPLAKSAVKAPNDVGESVMTNSTYIPGNTQPGIPDFFEPEQLFRYASDLHELMGQYGRLQQRHQQVLEYLGCGEQGDDLLLNTLLQSFDLYLVTDTQGDISHISPGLEKELCLSASEVIWQPIMQLMPADQSACINALFGSFFRVGATRAIQMRRIFLSDTSHGSHIFEALVLQGGNLDRPEIYWLLSREHADRATAAGLEKCLPLEGSSQTALMITDPDGRIRAINSAFTRITGYSHAEIVGQNPQMLDSGLQPSGFFADFWRDLEAAGSWSGDIFNRRKGGQVYFQWQTVRAAQNGIGETLAYVCAFSDLSQPRNADQQLARFNLDDALICLPSRPLFEQRLTQAMLQAVAQNTRLWVFALGLDGFKAIVDTLGHAAGERVMRECSTRLASLLQTGATVARVGNSEFLILLQDADRSPNLGRVAEILLQAISDPVQLDGQSVLVTASIGCGRYPQDGPDMASLLKSAHVALQSARKLVPHFSYYQGDSSTPGNDG